MARYLIIDGSADGKELLRLCVTLGRPDAEVLFYDTSRGCPAVGALVAGDLACDAVLLSLQTSGPASSASAEEPGLAWIDALMRDDRAPPLIAIGDATGDDPARARAAGADEFVGKRGISPTRLVKAIEDACRRREMFQLETSPEVVSRPDSPPPPDMSAEHVAAAALARPEPADLDDPVLDTPVLDTPNCDTLVLVPAAPAEALYEQTLVLQPTMIRQLVQEEEKDKGEQDTTSLEAELGSNTDWSAVLNRPDQCELEGEGEAGSPGEGKGEAEDENEDHSLDTIRLPRPLLQEPEPLDDDTAVFFRVPGYRLVRRVGRGGTSSAWLADRTSDNLRVILKILRTDRPDGRTSLEDLLREYEIIHQLEHPNIARIYERGQAGQCAFIAMEYLSGEDLAAKIDNVCSTPDAIDHVRAIARGLGAAHAKGIVHRDVKPNNVLFRGNGELAIIDFGIAKLISDDTSETGPYTVKGTPYYMSPEHIQSLGADARSDLYSLGVVMFELLTGRKPFESSSLHELICAHLEAPVPELPRHHAKLQRVLEGLLAKDPDDRFQSTREFLVGLDIAVADDYPMPQTVIRFPTERTAASR